MFPSPCGDMVLKLFFLERGFLSWKRFPSPCGDMVLKFKEQYQTIQQARVSVPLRGYGFEIMGWYIIRKDRKMFPSPCGDMVLKLARLRAIRYR